MRLTDQFAKRTALCVAATMAFIGAHELVHVVVGQALGLGAHFTSLTSADADATRALTAGPGAYAWMSGAGPLFTTLASVGAVIAAPRARARGSHLLAVVLGWMALFGLTSTGIQLMTLAGPAGVEGNGVDTAAVLVGYFKIGWIARVTLAFIGVVIVLGVGFALGNALGDHQRSSGEFAGVGGLSSPRRTVGVALILFSIASVGVGAVLLIRGGQGNPMGPFFLADALWGGGWLVLTPWRRPGPRFVRDVWLVPAIAAMAVLTLVGILFPSDYTVAALFFLPQLATAAYAARNAVDPAYEDILLSSGLAHRRVTSVAAPSDN
jgi:hypothetical protein